MNATSGHPTITIRARSRRAPEARRREWIETFEGLLAETMPVVETFEFDVAP